MSKSLDDISSAIRLRSIDAEDGCTNLYIELLTPENFGIDILDRLSFTKYQFIIYYFSSSSSRLELISCIVVSIFFFNFL